jgi:hypothetical protein
MPTSPYDDALDARDPPRRPSPEEAYRELLEARDRAERQQLQAVLRSTLTADPARAAEARRLALRYGVPAPVIARDLDQWRARASLEGLPLDRIQAETPHLAAWLQEPGRAAVARDDLERLGLLEWLVTAPPRAFAQGLAQVQYARLRTESLFRPLSQAEQDRLNALRAAMDAGGPLGAGDAWFRQAVTGAARLLPTIGVGFARALQYGLAGAATTGAGGALVGSLLPGVGTAAGAATGAGLGFRAGALYGALRFGFELEAGLAYDEYLTLRDELGRPLDPAVAKAAAIAAGTLNAGLEAFGLERLAASVPGLRQLTGTAARHAVAEALRVPTVRAALGSLMRTYAGTLSAETVTEVAQRAVTILSGELAKAASGQPFVPRSPGEVATDLYQELVGSLQAFALTVAPGPALRLAHDLVRVRQAERQRAFFTALGEAAAQSDTVTRLPEDAQALLERATRDGPVAHVYVSLAAWRQYWQDQGVDPAEVAREVTGDGRAWQEAQRTGDLAIPTARYAVRLAPTRHHQALLEDLRLEPGALSAREARAAEARLRDQMQEAAQAAARTEPVPPARVEQVRRVMRERLVEAGTPASAAEAYADLWAAAIGTVAARAGLDPVALFERYAVQVSREGFEPGAPEATGAAAPPEPAAAPPAAAPPEAAPAAGAPPGAPSPAAAAPQTAEAASTLAPALVRAAEAEALRLAGLPPEFVPVGAEPPVPPPAPRLPPDVRAFLELRMRLAEEAAAAQGRTLTEDEREIIRQQVLEPVRAGAEAALAAAQQRARADRRARQPAPVASEAAPERQALQAEPTVAAEPEARAPEEFEQRVFHGSPWRFDRFSLEAIGTGEGAQAFGWGLYFASRREVAQWYRDRLAERQRPRAGPELRYQGRNIWAPGGLYEHLTPDLKLGALDLQTWLWFVPTSRRDRPIEWLREHAAERLARMRDLQMLEPEAWTWERAYLLQAAQAAVALLDAYGPALTVEFRPEVTPTLYTVEIPEDDAFLDWDRPLSLQPARVRQALGRLGYEPGAHAITTGDALMRRLEDPALRARAEADPDLAGGLREIEALLEAGDEQAALVQWWRLDAAHAISRIAERMDDPTGQGLYQSLMARIQLQRLALGDLPADLQRRIASLRELALREQTDGPLQEAASRLLAHLGVAGIRYLDGLSRGAGTGGASANYVVFDDQAAQIVEYAQGPPPPRQWAPPWYSTLERVIEQKMPARATVEQVRRLISQGVTADERRWTGIEEWLAEQEGLVAKADVLHYLRAHAVRVVEVQLGRSARYKSADMRVRLASNRLMYHLPDDWHDERGRQFLRAAAQGAWDQPAYQALLERVPALRQDAEALAEAWQARAALGPSPVEATRYPQYTLPEAEHYRELLLTWPPEQAGTVYESPHWRVPNVVAHVRFDDRVDAEGRRLLFLEEIQSDWHQQGRERGYAPRETRSQQQVREQVRSLSRRTEQLRDDLLMSLRTYAAMRASARLRYALGEDVPLEGVLDLEALEAIEALRRRYREAADTLERLSGLPVERATLEWALAAEQAEDQIAEAAPHVVSQYPGGVRHALMSLERQYYYRRMGVSGPETAEYERLSEALQQAIAASVELRERSEETLRAFGAWLDGLPAGEQPPPEAPFRTSWAELAFKRMVRLAAEEGYDAIAWTTGDQQVARYKLQRFVDELAWHPLTEELVARKDGETVGSFHVPRQSLAAYVGEDVAARLLAAPLSDEGWQVIRGRALNIAGSGMRVFYDEMLPRIAAQLGKRWGVSPDRTVLRIGRRRYRVHVLPIPEAMRDAVLTEGYPLFQDAVPYERDLFGTPVTDPRPGARLATQTVFVQSGTREVGTTQIRSPEDLAVAAMSLAEEAEESLDVVLTDDAGRIVGVVGGVTGQRDATWSGWPTLIAELIRVPGARAAWAVQHDPSGPPHLRDADRDAAAWLASLLTGSGIEVRGLMALGAGATERAYEALILADGSRVRGSVAVGGPPRARVPVYARRLVDTETLGDRIDTPQQALEASRALLGAQFGVVLLDARHRPMAAVPIPRAQAEQVRGTGGLRSLWLALSQAGAGAAVVYAPQAASADAAMDVAVALHGAGLPVLDVFAGDRSVRSDRVMEGFVQPRRGAIRFGPNRQVEIRLFERADLSTFLHESGHFFYELLADVVDELRQRPAEALTADQRQLIGDYDTLLRWLGVERRDQLRREHHEQVARAFEAYLMEGRAPSSALRRLFARFRAWLIGVYRSLTRLHVELTDEVRAVFDRLLASDEAIAAATAEGQVRPLFLRREDAGLDEAGWQAYLARVREAEDQSREALDRRLLAEVHRAQTVAARERRQAVRAAVEAELRAAPVYQALFALQTGTAPDGTPLEAPPKLDARLIRERYGTERLKRLPRGVAARDGGLDPDLVAEQYGFDSGDALLRALETVTPYREAVRAETDRRLQAQDGSLLLDPRRYDEAQAALAEQARDDLIRHEIRVLTDLLRERGRQAVAAERAERAYERRWLEAEARLRIAMAEGRKQAEIDALRQELANLKRRAMGGPALVRTALPPQREILAQARREVAETPIARLNPGAYWAASRRFAQEAVEAAARQDFEAAIRAKTQELLTVALAREQRRAQEEIARRLERIQALGRKAVRERIGRAGGDYLDQIDALLDQYDFARVSARALERRIALRRWVQEREAEGLPVEIPEEVLDEARRISYRELTVEAFEGVTDTIFHLQHLAQLKFRLLRRRAARELDAVAAEVASTIRASRSRRLPARVRDRRPSEERRRLVEAFFAGHRKLASLAREMDGFREGGPVWEALVRPLNEAADREVELVAEATERLGALIERAWPGAAKRQLYVREFVPAVRRSLSRMERLLIALNWGNEGNRDRVRRGEGWTDQQVQAVLDTLSLADWEFVQGVWDLLDRYWPAIVAKQRRVVGVAPQKVEATPVVTRWGTFRGGYFPLKYDDRLSPTAAAHLELDTAKLQAQAAYVRATTRRGHLEARRQTVRLPVRLDFGVITEHLQQVIHDLTHHEALIDVSRILGHREVQRAIYETYGDVVYKELRDTIRDVAFGDLPATHVVERALHHLRVGTSIAFLGWNLGTALLQPLGLTQSVVRIGPRWVARGVGRWIRDAVTFESTAAWIQQRSTFMRHRWRTQQREIAEIRTRLGVSAGRLSGWVDEVLQKTTLGALDRQAVADSYFWLITAMQRVADIPTWLGAYEKAMAEGRDEATAVALADQAVLDSQGGGQIKDLARVQRGGPALKLWTNFYGFFSTTYNLLVESTTRTRWRHPGEVARLAADYLMLVSVPAVLGYAIREAVKPGDAQGDDAGWLWVLARESAAYLMGTVLLVREAAGTVAGYLGYEGPAGARAFAAASRLARQVAQGESDAAFWRALNETAGIVLHYPAQQVRRTVEGLTALLEGRTRNPLALVMGEPGEARPARR